MVDRIQAAVPGAAKATNEYIEGDLDAAKHAQDAAKTGEVGDLIPNSNYRPEAERVP
ncbi:hypothetical protein GCM10010347_10580 [Streptomyces cirratus]|uniref:Uncharacterized protein n=1 Tax=Streptomyces cirratus TaxID=68187 RepID=A0ABQ3ELN9_9ACTN|nr:hypothetical protein GCM10010347_10580 [Streptomyces cirratus]